MNNSLVLIFLFLISFKLVAQNDWKFKKEKDGVQLSMSKVVGSKIKATKGKIKIDAPIHQVAGVLRTYSNFQTLFRELKSIKTVSEFKGGSLDVVLYNDFPFPLKDHALLLHYDYVQQKDYSQIDVTFVCQLEISEEQLDGHKHLKSCNGNWELIRLSDNETQVVYTFHADLDIFVPAGLVNYGLVDGPIYALNQLKTIAESDKYQDYQFDF